MVRWPATLAGRLMLILLSGLLVAQLVAGLILLSHRGETLYQAGGIYATQRIASIVQALETLRPGDREYILSVMNTPSLHITLENAEPVKHGTANPAVTDHSQHIKNLLDNALVGSRKTHVSMSDYYRRDANTDGSSVNDGDFDGAFTAWVQLDDGSWVRFDHRLGVEPYAVPKRLLLTLIVLLIPVVLLSWFAVRWLTKPLRMLSHAAIKLRSDLQRPPLPEEGPREVRDAASAFNVMQTHLLHMMRDREHLLAAISHDLRTPITRLRLRSQQIEDDELRNKFERDIDQMQELAISTLDFVRDVDSSEQREPLDIVALLETIQHDREEMGQKITVEGSADPYPVNFSAFRRCMENLIDNAVNYGYEARVSVHDEPGCLVLRVVDSGPGIPEAQLQHVTEPFYRVEKSRSRETGGVGLGLSIARNIVDSHGGEMTLRNHPKGGLEIVIRLPRESGNGV
ncbi:ATP-binding protein [Thiohalophilus sp.]|uniref:ATP-binding protein n=1 Tax=Thiohalophilus sp. TaxID=3028392 RepID=UPI002ACD8DBE|nr:ATP-binding protein [Thiohalophilus sp.]MDZ7663351.1 ATP-binding protein [Thiohalophilus sp.]